MSAKIALLFCLQVFLMKTVLSQCVPSGLSCGLGGLGALGLSAGPSPYGSPYGCNNGNPFANIVPPQPVGVSISADDLIIEGILDVAGNLPFMGTVIVEGVVPNSGVVQASYSCGNGNVGINDGGLAFANSGAGYNLGQSVGVDFSRGCGCI